MVISEVIGMRIQAQRVTHEWSQAHLGVLVGARLGREWSRQAVSAAEKGKRAFTASEIVALADALGVTVPWLMTPPANADVIELAPGVALGVDLARLLSGESAVDEWRRIEGDLRRQIAADVLACILRTKGAAR